jgi:hypothetical protein
MTKFVYQSFDETILKEISSFYNPDYCRWTDLLVTLTDIQDFLCISSLEDPDCVENVTGMLYHISYWKGVLKLLIPKQEISKEGGES